MLINSMKRKHWLMAALWLVIGGLLSACAAPTTQPAISTDTHQEEHEHIVADSSPELPSLVPVPLEAGEKLHVVATMNLIGDVVREIGGEQIKLTTLLPVGADPHGYSATPADLRSLSQAHVVFMSGLGLEGSLTPVLENADGAALLVSVNASLELMEMADDEHGGVDPHTWTSVRNVQQWVENIEQVLSDLDPANADVYQAAAKHYAGELEALESELISAMAGLPAAKRKLVTDHAVFGYFAAHYGFQIVGAVVPALSSLAAPSAQELAALQEQIQTEGVNAIFVGTTVNPKLAEQLAADLGIQVVTLYTESLSAADGPAATYLDFMRYNVTAIVAALNR